MWSLYRNADAVTESPALPMIQGGTTMKKTSRKLLSVLLALVLMLSVIPMTTLAAGVEGWAWRAITRDTTTYHFEDGTYVTIHNRTSYIIDSTNKDYDAVDWNPVVNEKPNYKKDYYTLTHIHEYGLEISRDGHFSACACGARHSDPIPHIDPKDAVDGRCVCGYKFMDNADLTVLWLSNVKLDKAFKADTTEYKGTLVNKDAEAVNVSALTFDAKAGVEFSGDMILKDGTNVITVKVTAEDGKETRTYTVTIEK